MGAACCRLFPMAIAAALSSCATSPERDARTHVLLVGDSTLARVTGYGDALCARFDALTKCENLARGGRSSKSYRAEGLWRAALERISEPGYRTFVLIQFGHNDQPGKAERSTTLPEFKQNLRRYVDEVRAAGAVPLLVTPLTRRSFRDDKLLDDLQPWSDTARLVARESNTRLLDLHEDSARAVAAMGALAALSLAELPPTDAALAAAKTGTTVAVAKPTALAGAEHVPTFDYTHLGPRGAAVFSAIVAREIRESVPDLGRRIRNTQD